MNLVSSLPVSTPVFASSLEDRGTGNEQALKTRRCRWTNGQTKFSRVRRVRFLRWKLLHNVDMPEH